MIDWVSLLDVDFACFAYLCRLLLLVSCLVYASALKMEVVNSSKASSSLRTTRVYKPEYRTLQTLKKSIFHISVLKGSVRAVRTLSDCPSSTTALLPSIARSNRHCRTLAHTAVVFPSGSLHYNRFEAYSLH
jgi:hypothetical protein